MKYTNTVWFWVLQIFGWGLFVTAQRLNEIFNIDYPAKYYAILYALISVVFGILCTTLLRYYLKNKFSFDQYKKKGNYTHQYRLLYHFIIFFIVIFYNQSNT